HAVDHDDQHDTRDETADPGTQRRHVEKGGREDPGEHAQETQPGNEVVEYFHRLSPASAAARVNPPRKPARGAGGYWAAPRSPAAGSQSASNRPTADGSRTPSSRRARSAWRGANSLPGAGPAPCRAEAAPARIRA